MRRLSGAFAWPLLLALACGPALPGDARDPGDESQRVATADGQVSAYDAPAQRFSPRPHPPRRRPAVPAPRLGSLPEVSWNLGRCYGAAGKRAGGTRDRDGDRIPDRDDQGPNDPETYNGIEDGDGCPDHGRVVITKSKIEIAGGAEDEKAAEEKPKRERGKKAKGKAPAQDPADGIATGGEYWRDELGYYRDPAPAGAAQPSLPSSSPPAEPTLADGERSRKGAANRWAEAEEGDFEDDAAEIAGVATGAEQQLVNEELPEYEDWGAEIYLSNDDTMSLSSAQRVIYAIDNFLPLPLEHVRPHELLNYFAFETQRVGADDDFSVLADIEAEPREEGIYTLGLAVKGRPVSKASRRNTALTWVVDRSGSMHDEGRMEYLKRGLRRMVDELKDGDLVHLVLFDHAVCVPVENFVVGRDDRAELERAIDLLRPKGSTDIHRGLSRGYEIADRAYQAEYSNRVVLVTDALANTGVTDDRLISMISKYYDTRRIRLSGVGVGREFNDALLDRLTERGKGAYVFLGSAAEVDAVFGPRFISLIETTALDVHFLLHLPESLRMNVFYGEESSTVKEDVQAIHYFANTSQLFLSDLMARGGALRPQDDVMLTVEYEDPESGDALFEEYAFNLGEIESEAYNVRKGRLIMAWVDMLAEMAARPVPPVYRYSAGSWEDADGWQSCEDGRQELARLAEGLGEDGETKRVLDLWDKYCSRYERPRNPVKREIVKPGDSWPGANR